MRENMLTESLHNHTFRCNHAEGTEREYIEAALAGGMKVLGFSDHSPQVFEGDYYSGFRMRPEQLDDYCGTLLKLKEEYRGKIELHIGFELEYYPKYFENTMKLLRSYPVEYLIMGQHFLKNETEKLGTMAPTHDEEVLKLYVDQCSEGFSTGVYTYAAHPDCIRYEGDDAVYEKHITRFCENALRYDVPLEINLLGIRTHRHYPREEFWKIAGQVGNSVVCGSDAHRAADVWDETSYEIAQDLVRRYSLRLVRPSGVLKGVK